MVSNNTLMKIALYAGVGVIGTGLFLQFRLQDQVRRTDCYREAMKCVRSHPEAVRHFGEPIKDGRINVGDSKANGSDGTNGWFQVPLKGPKTSGILYYWTINEDKQWKLSRMELALDSMPGERFLLRNNSGIGLNSES